MQHWATDWNSLKERETRKRSASVLQLDKKSSFTCAGSVILVIPEGGGNVLFNLGGTVHKVVTPELEGRILDQLDEGDEETPRVRPVHNQPLQQNPGGEKERQRKALANSTSDDLHTRYRH